MPGSSRHMLRAVAILGVFAIGLLAPAIAGARITVPPGSTEGDQYFEQVPNGGGSGSVNHPGGPGSPGGGQGVAATQALNALGADGQAAAAVANANKPPQSGTPADRGSADSASSSTEGDGGMGALFPILLVITALGAVAYGVRRRLTPA